MLGVTVGKLCILWLLCWQIHGVFNGVEGQDLQVGFYGLTCPTAETIVTNVVTQAFLLDNTVTAGLIRLLFHDCFVNGCDASILLIGNNTEQTAIPNLTVRGYGIVTTAKSQLELVCPGIVSCADIIALAARDAVTLLGIPAYDVLTGRRDGLTPGVVTTLPAPTDGVLTSTTLFAAVGLTQTDMITLLGAHSVGTAQCQSFNNRLYNFQNTGLPDPTLNATFLATLRNLCPLTGTGLETVPLDWNSDYVLDVSYYNTIKSGEGVLVIDQEVTTDLNTSVYVSNYAGAATGLSLTYSNLTFAANFVAALTKLSRIGLKTSMNGEVRKVCEVVNS